jgi:hypothetical protein
MSDFFCEKGKKKDVAPSPTLPEGRGTGRGKAKGNIKKHEKTFTPSLAAVAAG